MAIEAIRAMYEAGLRIVLLDGPTGAGKTVVAEAVRRARGRRGTYLCTRKSLQAQMVRDFCYAVELKGRDNYPTLDFPARHKRPLDDPGAAVVCRLQLRAGARL